MRTLRLSLVGPVALACLAFGALPTVAQDEADGRPVVVTGSEQCGGRSGGVNSFSVPGVRSQRGWVAECVNTMSDPRVDGTWVNTYNSDCYPGTPTQTCVYWGTHVLDGPDGGWDCTWAGTDYDPVWPGELLVLAVCPGTGGFEGMTYIAQHSTADFGDGTDFYGVIYEGPAPPVYGAPPATSE